jgi:Ca-activated chloride channel family protein
MGSQLDFYDILGVGRAATQEEIRRAYLKAVQRLHPDKNVNPGETELFLDVQQAYETLGDPSRRARYDATLPPEPEAPPSPIQVGIQFSRARLPRLSEPQVIYALLAFSPSVELVESPSPPLNLCLVLDVSTSMQGAKLETVKETAIQLLRRLRPQDIFSMVAFSDRAQLQIPPARGADARRAESKIHMLRADGGTEIFQGLEAGVREVRRSLGPARTNHVILLTDGRTYGDESSCLELAANAAADGIGISGLGIGSGWNDVFLDDLAGRAGGSCIYVADPQDITRQLLAKFDQLSEVFSSESALEFKLGEGVDLSYAFRLQGDPAPLSLGSPLPLGALQRHTPLQVLLEFHMPDLANSGDPLVLLDGQMTAALPSTPAAAPSILPILLERPLSVEADPDPPPHALIRAMSRVTLYRMQERARREVQEGELEKATERLKNLATHLLAQGEQRLAHTVLIEVEHIEQEKSFSENGEKDIKFGTRALIPPERPK